MTFYIGTGAVEGERSKNAVRAEMRQNWDQVKTQIARAFPGTSASEIEQYRGNPDELVSTIELKTGQPTDQVEQQRKQFAR